MSTIVPNTQYVQFNMESMNMRPMDVNGPSQFQAHYII